MACFDNCRCLGERGQRSILYGILNKDTESTQRSPGCQKLCVPRYQACSCRSEKKVVLHAPQTTFKSVSAVLLKTLRFVKNVPCFRGLPAEDQLKLVRNSWAPLLILGMAQDSVDFEITETPAPSLLQKILTNNGQDKQQTSNGFVDHGVSFTDVQGIKTFLSKCRGLDISLKEYAYLKGAVLFNPDVTELLCRGYIQALQREAHQALNEHVKMIYRGNTARFAKLYIALSMLRSINSHVVAGLFFKPVFGTTSMDEILLKILYEK
ncbi:nuclear receptor subfamily 0 group B member 1 [Aplochiton taeniatus]